VEQEQLPRNRARYLFRALVPSWRPTEVQALWVIRVAIALGVLVLIGYLLGAAFQVSTELFTGLLAPLVTLAGYRFQRQQGKSQRQTEEQRGQDSAVQEYFSTMKDLLIGQEHSSPHQQQERGEEALQLARARTVALLSSVDSSHQGGVVRFLSEAGWLDRENPVVPLGGTRHRAPKAVALGEYALTLGGIKLENIDLQGADLSGTDLSHVDLNFANLTGADLTNADLSGTLLVGADLVGADLTDATLDHAALHWVNLLFVSITDEELQRLAARGALMGAILPDGSRPLPPSPEIVDEYSKHVETQLAQRELELERIARLLRQQADAR
jgi:Pentapeptide repeats (8 copies)